MLKVFLYLFLYLGYCHRSVSWGGGGDNFIVVVTMQRFCINDSMNIIRNIDDVHRNLLQFNMDVESGVGGGGAEGHVHILKLFTLCCWFVYSVAQIW